MQKPESEYSDGRIMDLFTKNGECADILKENFISKGDVQNSRKAFTLVKKYHDVAASLMMLDLKDPHSGYLPTNATNLSDYEDQVCLLFQPNERKKRVKAILSNLSIDFIMREGSLKKDLLEEGGFDADEINYLNSPSGSQDFCQVAEFFMTGFKFGLIGKTQTAEFCSQKYVTSISDKLFQSYCKSTTLYPQLYSETYSPTGTFAQALKNVYAVSGEYESVSKITTLTLLPKKI